MTSNAWIEQVITKALEDAAFKEELLRNPKAAVVKLTGVTVPDNMALNIVEESKNTFYLVLPAVSDELSDADLSFVVGGGDWGNPRRNSGGRGSGGSDR